MSDKLFRKRLKKDLEERISDLEIDIHNYRSNIEKQKERSKFAYGSNRGSIQRKAHESILNNKERIKEARTKLSSLKNLGYDVLLEGSQKGLKNNEDLVKGILKRSKGYADFYKKLDEMASYEKLGSKKRVEMSMLADSIHGLRSLKPIRDYFERKKKKK